MKADIKKVLGDIPKKNLIYILGAIGILLLFFSSAPDKPEAVVVENKVDYCRTLEERLEEILPKISGVGKVDVMITAENHGEIRLAKDKSENTDETLVLNQKGGGEDTKIVEEIYPEIKGVIVVADGGKNARIKSALTEAITALLGVESHKIKIFERKAINDF